MEYAVEGLKLKKKYGKEIALQEIDFTLERNKIYGLLGRNGAGKTTLLNIIGTNSFQTKGEIRVFGEKPFENSKVLDQICLVKESGNYLAHLKVQDIIKLASKFYSNWDNSFKEELIIKFNLKMNKRYSALSKGMKSALGIVIGLASRAPLTIYDEPYLGLDATSRWLFYDILLKDYIENPRTIVLSTHLIDEVSKVLENIIILDEGKIILSESLEDLRTKAISLTGRVDLVEEATKDKRIINYQIFGRSATAAIYDNISSVEINEWKSSALEVKALTLQDFFIYITLDKKGAK
ncbi:MAG TPA: ABC transporter ATP-binding protein [Clostridiaceae bacterium]